MTWRKPHRLVTALVCLGLGAAQTLLMPHPARADGAHQRRALLIAVDYPDVAGADFPHLNTAADVEALQAALTHLQFDPKDPHTDLTVLKTRAQTTRQGILDALQALIGRTRPGDIVYIHYSGHGSEVPDTNEPDGYDQTLVPSDYANDGSRDIRDKEIAGLLRHLKGKGPDSVLLTFDCCHSGTITRGGRMIVRGKKWAERLPFAGKTVPHAATSTRGGPDNPVGQSEVRGSAKDRGYVVISACRDEQYAYEAPSGGGHAAMGRLSFLLSQVLPQCDKNTTYPVLFEQIKARMVQDFDQEQSPVMEGDVNTVVLDGTARTPQPYIPVSRGTDGQLHLSAGLVQGMTEGSRFALYSGKALTFRDADKLAEARLTRLGFTDSGLILDGPLRAGHSAAELATAHAVEIEHQYGDDRLTVDPRDFQAVPGAQEVLTGLTKDGIIREAGTGKPADVRLARQTDAPHGPLGLVRAETGVVFQTLTEGGTLPSQIQDALKREAKWRSAKSLINESAASPVRIEMRLVPAEVTGSRGAGYVWKQDKAFTGDHPMLHDGDFFTIKVHNTGTVPAYVAVLDLQSDTSVEQLWPDPDHPIQDNTIKPGETRRLWDGEVTNAAVFEAGAPYGTDIFRAIATREHVDFYFGGTSRGPSSPIDQFLRLAANGTRGARLAPVSQWYTSSQMLEVPKTR